jgi:hypothetical protein
MRGKGRGGHLPIGSGSGLSVATEFGREHRCVAARPVPMRGGGDHGTHLRWLWRRPPGSHSVKEEGRNRERQRATSSWFTDRNRVPSTALSSVRRPERIVDMWATPSFTGLFTGPAVRPASQSNQSITTSPRYNLQIHYLCLMLIVILQVP